MSRPTPNPVENTYSTASPPLSSVTYHIAGILTTIHGLSELPASTSSVACLWLLHPRLQTQSCMAPFAAHIITDHNRRVQSHQTKSQKGLIAVSFDQRNHGTREVQAISNEAWRSGNERHAQDMFSCYHGTALDTSLLMDCLPAYIFPENERQITQHMVMGISLGGHAAWHCLMQEPRISSGIVVIGCPDYTRLMSDRARLSKLKSWTKTEPKGSAFIGSRDFPQALVEAVGRYDPAGLLWGQLKGVRRGEEHFHKVNELEKEILVPVMAQTLGNKRILNLSGGADKLVPYKCGQPFLDWLKDAIGTGGWFEDGGVVLEDVIIDGVGHEVPPSMVKEMVRFVNETIDGAAGMPASKRGSRGSRGSRI